jgi:hypothetical protein
MAKPNPTLPELSEQEIARFRQSIEQNDPDECWPWQKARDQDGYGLFKIRGRMRRATRYAYLLHYGVQPGEMLVLHHCDNPPCCNPAHLFLGTVRDNALDCKAKGRLNTASGDNNGSRKRPDRLQRSDGHWTHRAIPPTFGERNGAARLTAERVGEIRALHAAGALSIGQIAAQFEVAHETVRKVILRRTWRHVR